MFNQFAKISAAVVALLFAVVLLPNLKATAQDEVKPSDTAAFFKAKCVMCHGAKAEKKFDPALTEDQMLEAVLKGKKAEKPPHMPAYEPKGVTADDAKALIAHMKKLREAPTN